MHVFHATLLPAMPGDEVAGQWSHDVIAGFLIALGVAIMAGLLIISARSKMIRRNEQLEHIKAAQARHQAEHALIARDTEQLREYESLIEQKAERIEQLLAEADERIATLRALSQPAAEPKSVHPPHEPTDPLVRCVYELADTGRNSVEIAQELDEHVGKVELILALRGR